MEPLFPFKVKAKLFQVLGFIAWSEKIVEPLKPFKTLKVGTEFGQIAL